MITEISPATARDAWALVALRSAVAQGMTQQFGEGPWSTCPTKADVVRQLRASRVLVARRDSEIIGTVRLATALPWAIESNPFTPVTTALYVLGLGVGPACRGHGVARSLMDAAKDAARSRPAQALWLDAYDHISGAGPFYLRCGFREVGRTKHREMPLIYYEWLVETR